MYNIFEGHFDPLRLSKIGMANPVVASERLKLKNIVALPFE